MKGGMEEVKRCEIVNERREGKSEEQGNKTSAERNKKERLGVKKEEGGCKIMVEMKRMEEKKEDERKGKRMKGGDEGTVCKVGTQLDKKKEDKGMNRR